MKKLMLAVMIGLVLTLPAGMAAAQEFAYCVQDVDVCNDFAISFDTITAVNGIWKVHGYEYGCGITGRSIYGTLDLAPDFAYLTYTTSGFRTSDDAFFSATYRYQFDYITLAGPYIGTEMTVVDGVREIRGSAQLIQCPLGVGAARKEGAQVTKKDRHR